MSLDLEPIKARMAMLDKSSSNVYVIIERYATLAADVPALLAEIERLRRVAEAARPLCQCLPRGDCPCVGGCQQ